MPAAKSARRPAARQRNPRGQGERLRDDIIEAASRLLADPASPPLTLRAVAREAGVAATSVYLHFDDIASLVLAVSARRFGELVRLQDAAVGAEETFWLAARSARTAVAAALAELVSEGAFSEEKALELARMYLHDNAAKLYGGLQ